MDARVKPGHDTGCFCRRYRLRVLAARLRPRFASSFAPSKTEGAGKTGCALHPRSRVQLRKENAHTSIQVSGNTPAFPAQWLYGLLRALPGERLFCHRRRARSLLANLTPAPRRQDHTTSPYASRHPRQSWHPRPPHPVRTFVTMADAPLRRDRMAKFSFDLPDGLSGIFLRAGWTDFSSDLPVGQISPSSRPARRSDWATTRPHHARIATTTARLREPLPRESIGFLTQLLFGKRHDEKSRDLSGSRRQCPSRDGGFRCTAFPECISRSGQQHSKRPHGLQRGRPLLARTW